ncbi:MAG: septum formation protein Maf [Planctomycetaceae bacterium]|nr:septum formation protein Maf [Planctomycetaceae bacterium]
MKLILASTSSYRESLLRRLGLLFESAAPGVEEAHWKQTINDPRELAVTLAREKANAIASHSPDAVVIGADQVAVIDSEILDKPGSRAANIEQLKRLSGQTHQLLTAVCVKQDQTERILLDQTFLRMRDLTPAEIEAYVDLDEPFDCAGGFKYEAHGVSLFEEVRCTDTTAIQGLPLLTLSKVLRDFGLHFPMSSS